MVLSLLAAESTGIYSSLSVDQISDAIANPTTVFWLDIEDPGEAELALLRDVLEFHPLAIEDAVRASERPKVDLYSLSAHPVEAGRSAVTNGKADPTDSAHLGTYYFIVFYAAEYVRASHEIRTQPISLFVGPRYLVTVHPRPVSPLAAMQTRLSTMGGQRDGRIGALVYHLLDAIVDDYFPIMDEVADRAEELEDAVFADFDAQSIQTIFALKKQLLRLRHIVAPARDVLNVLLRRELPIIKSRDLAYLQDVYDHIVRVTDMIDTYRDLLSNVLESYLSVQSNNLNQIVKTLTMASILLMSAALIAGIYGMNFRFMPELGSRWGYPGALGLMLVVDLGLLLFFRRRGWF